MPALPVEGTAQSPALEQLVPPAKYPWKLATKGCEVVQVALADAPERCSTADGVAEALLLPQLQPQWCVIFDDVAPQQLQTSADLRCVLYAAEAVASALKLDEATDAGGGGATALKGPLKGLVCRGSPEVVRVAQGGGGGVARSEGHRSGPPAYCVGAVQRHGHFGPFPGLLIARARFCIFRRLS